MIPAKPAPTKRQPNSQHGGAAVEFALILALLISILAGIFEFGRAFWYYDALTKATRDGARLMSVTNKGAILDPGVADAQTLVVNAVTAAGVPNFTTANVSVTCLDATFADVPSVPSCSNGTAPGGVRVQIVGYSMTIGQFIPFLLGGSSSYTADLSPHTTMRYMLL